MSFSLGYPWEDSRRPGSQGRIVWSCI